MVALLLLLLLCLTCRTMQQCVVCVDHAVAHPSGDHEQACRRISLPALPGGRAARPVHGLHHVRVDERCYTCIARRLYPCKNYSLVAVSCECANSWMLLLLICRYEYMIDNVILLLKGTLNGRDVNELIPQVRIQALALPHIFEKQPCDFVCSIHFCSSTRWARLTSPSCAASARSSQIRRDTRTSTRRCSSTRQSVIHFEAKLCCFV